MVTAAREMPWKATATLRGDWLAAAAILFAVVATRALWFLR